MTIQPKEPPMPSEEAIACAAQAWCDPRTSDRVMDTVLATVFAERVDGWIEIAKQAQRSVEYYQGLLDEIGKTIGRDAFISDDGSVQADPLRAKLPELVRTLRDTATRRGEQFTAWRMQNP